MGNQVVPAAVPRRIEALAIIVERIQRSGTCPSYGEVAKAMRPPVDRSRVPRLIDQLVRLGAIAGPPASRRDIVIRDLQLCRELIDQALGQQGWRHSKALGCLEQPSTFEHLPILPLIELPPSAE